MCSSLRETHWKQCQFFAHTQLQPPRLRQDDRVKGTLTLEKRPGSRRELAVHLTLNHRHGASTHMFTISSSGPATVGDAGPSNQN